MVSMEGRGLMSPEIVGVEGPLAGQRFPVEDADVTLGRDDGNTVVTASRRASRRHAEVRREGNNHVVYDRGSRNGTLVNGERVTSHRLRPGDRITVGDETFRFELAGTADSTIVDLTETWSPPPDAAATAAAVRSAATVEPEPVLRVTVSGGGPVGLSLALLLDELMGGRVAVTVYDGRWTRDGSQVVWKDESQGNVRRQQVVTIQSRQFLSLPGEVQARLFSAGAYSEMWPAGPDSIGGCGPRNVRIAHVEDRLLEIANEKPDRIRLVPEVFRVSEQDSVVNDHVLAICEGSRSRTRDHFTAAFGNADESIYSLDGDHLEDVVLGLRVKSRLPDPMTVLLTVAQNRFLLNSLHGEGFLNMRLTDTEAREVVGIDPVAHEFKDCIASRPCVMGRDDVGNFQCATHRTLFLPALIKGSALWDRVREGLALFDVAEEDLSAVTAFRLGMVQRPRFTAQLFPPTRHTPGTYGFLLGDAANAIHFWPGRGLNSGLASAISLARSLQRAWQGRTLRDADFVRHEAAMSMLQYRHKSRAWKAMVTTDDHGVGHAIKNRIAESIEAVVAEPSHGDADVDILLQRLRDIRDRLSTRLAGLPDDTTLRNHLRGLTPETLRTLVASGAWDTASVGGEEVDIDIFDHGHLPEAVAA
jgi:2-polyprenyl-6-methoxyphenol hydroxylase-like FAD-dependent oxidoreductase